MPVLSLWVLVVHLLLWGYGCDTKIIVIMHFIMTFQDDSVLFCSRYITSDIFNSKMTRKEHTLA